MNIDDMPAGRELDALVAEKVMGAVWDCGPLSIPHQNDSLLAPGHLKGSMMSYGYRKCGGGAFSESTPGSAVFERLPHYSTSIGAAWEVVGVLRTLAPKLAKAGCWGSVNVMLIKDEEGDDWVAGISDTFDSCLEGVNGFRLGAAGNTAPLAICRAALKAVGA